MWGHVFHGSPRLGNYFAFESGFLRAILCENQAKWEMRNFDLPSNFACNYILWGMSKNALCLGCYFIVVMVTPIVSWWQKI